MKQETSKPLLLKKKSRKLKSKSSLQLASFRRFNNELSAFLDAENYFDYEHFKSIFMETLNHHELSINQRGNIVITLILITHSEKRS